MIITLCRSRQLFRHVTLRMPNSPGTLMELQIEMFGLRTPQIDKTPARVMAWLLSTGRQWNKENPGKRKRVSRAGDREVVGWEERRGSQWKVDTKKWWAGSVLRNNTRVVIWDSAGAGLDNRCAVERRYTAMDRPLTPMGTSRCQRHAVSYIDFYKTSTNKHSVFVVRCTLSTTSSFRHHLKAILFTRTCRPYLHRCTF